MPRTTTWVGAGTSNWIPSGGSMVTGCEKPTASSSDVPAQLRAVADALDLEAALEARR